MRLSHSLITSHSKISFKTLKNSISIQYPCTIMISVIIINVICLFTSGIGLLNDNSTHSMLYDKYIFFFVAGKLISKHPILLITERNRKRKLVNPQFWFILPCMCVVFFTTPAWICVSLTVLLCVLYMRLVGKKIVCRELDRLPLSVSWRHRHKKRYQHTIYIVAVWRIHEKEWFDLSEAIQKSIRQIHHISIDSIFIFESFDMCFERNIKKTLFK